MAKALPPRRVKSGPVARADVSLGARSLSDPRAQFYYMVLMAERVLFPALPASCPDDRARVAAEIVRHLDLEAWKKRKVITAWEILWHDGPYPRYPESLRVYTPEGKYARRKALGRMLPHLTRFLTALDDPLENALL